jgi:hypothetical protein
MFWSPDGQSLGFIADGSLKRIDLDSHSVRTLANQVTRYFGAGGSWGTDDAIVFAAAAGGPILRIASVGASVGLQQPTTVTTLDPSRPSSHRFPQLIPDSPHFLYRVKTSDVERDGVYVVRTDGSGSNQLLGAGWSAAVFAPVQRQLLAVRGGTLIAQDIDLSTFRLSGVQKKVAENVYVDPIEYAAISASAAGHLAYRSGRPGLRQLTSFDRKGNPIETLGDPDTSAEENPSIDLTGRVAVQRFVGNDIEVWLLRRGSMPRQLTDRSAFSGGSVRSHPVFSPDGTRIVLSLISPSRGPYPADLYVVPSSRAEKGTLLLKTEQFKVASDWSYPHGRYLLYTALNPKTGRDVWALPLDQDGHKDGEPIRVAGDDSSWNEQEGQFVLDGRFIAYQTNRTGREQIFLKAFKGLDRGNNPEWAVGAGTLPRWSPKTGELIYLAPDGHLKTVSIRMAANGQDPDIQPENDLFDTRVGGVPTDRLAIYPDGDRFLLRPLVDPTQSPITVILNWKP